MQGKTIKFPHPKQLVKGLDSGYKSNTKDTPKTELSGSSVQTLSSVSIAFVAY